MGNSNLCFFWGGDLITRRVMTTFDDYLFRRRSLRVLCVRGKRVSSDFGHHDVVFAIAVYVGVGEQFDHAVLVPVGQFGDNVQATAGAK